MPFATFAPGPYAATYRTDAGQPKHSDLGLAEGVRRWCRILQPAPTQGGHDASDGIYRGGQCFVLGTVRECDPAALWPFSDTFLDNGGRMLTELAGVLTLTAVDGTDGPASITFGKAIVSRRHNSNELLATDRDVPVVWRCFPYVASGGQVVWFEETCNPPDNSV